MFWIIKLTGCCTHESVRVELVSRYSARPMQLSRIKTILCPSPELELFIPKDTKFHLNN